jgi:hypothetical protein
MELLYRRLKVSSKILLFTMWKIKFNRAVFTLVLFFFFGATVSHASDEDDWARQNMENFEEWHEGQQQWRQWESISQSQAEQESLFKTTLIAGLILSGLCSAIFFGKKSKQENKIIKDECLNKESVE